MPIVLPWDKSLFDAPGRLGPRRSARAGFVLIAVIWSLGLITILALVGIVGARFRGRATADIVAQAQAMAAADSGISLGILKAMRQPPGAPPTAPWRCLLPGDRRLAVAITDEAGKVDLNMATPALLALLFSNLAHDRTEGAQIAADIVAFRAAERDPPGDALLRRYAADGKPEGPKRAPFVSTLELDQVVGVAPTLLKAALPFVTVQARRPDVDVSLATPAMRRLLGVKDAGVAVATAPQETRTVTIVADAATPDGARFVREALVSIGGPVDNENGGPYVIREWRRADAGIPQAEVAGAALRPCFSGAI